MSAQDPQIVDPQEFIDILDYEFSGDTSTVEKKRAFVEAYRNEGSIFHAAKATGIHRATYYNWAERDPAFMAAVEDSKEDCYDQVESSVFKKAINGGTLESFFYLKAHRPKFRDRVSIDVEVVRTEIEQRMQQLNLKQLPVGMTEFIPAQGISTQATDTLQFPHPSAQTQKEQSDPDSNSASDD